MNAWQKSVEDFHRVMQQPIGDTPIMRDVALRYALIEEEMTELLDALRAGDMVEAVDGMVDAIYVILGAAVAFGIDLDPFFVEVHRTNMAKAGGGQHSNGKIIKPPDWQPPRIAEMLDKLKHRCVTCSGKGRVHDGYMDWHDCSDCAGAGVRA